MNNLLKRIITGLLGATVVLGLIYFHSMGFLFLLCVISIAACIEYFGLIGENKGRYLFLNVLVTLLIFLLIGVLLYRPMVNEGRLVLIITLLFAPFPVNTLLALYDKSLEKPLSILGKVAIYYLYILIPFVLFFLTSFDTTLNLGSYDFQIPMGILMLVWTTDSMAYFGGRLLGKNKLFERISPKKTWEGSIAGTLSGFVLAYFYYLNFDHQWNWLIASFIIIVLSQLGDLVESMIKRGLKIKDSGAILPGHGGILDRFDGFFLLLPVLFIYKMFSWWF